ncbi:MAG: DNA recombination protein RmuC, partial [Candidatus Paceibacteria bacterium]
MPEFFTILTLLIIVLLGVFALWFLLKRELKKIAEQKTADPAFNYLKQDIEHLKREVGESLRFSSQEIRSILQSTQQTYGAMMKELGLMQEIGRDMKSLQEFFRSPKHRGNIGEQLLEQYLEQLLPKQSFERQYMFSEGTVVDVIVKTNQGLIPIDAKFTTESFKRLIEAKDESDSQEAKKEFSRAVKKHIDDIARKYILPQQGTVDFAIMYVPAEPIYYEIVTGLPEVAEYATQKQVYLISPKTLYYFLKTIWIALRGAKIEETARQILRGFQEIQHESGRVSEELDKLVSHLDRAKAAANRTQQRFDRF